VHFKPTYIYYSTILCTRFGAMATKHVGGFIKSKQLCVLYVHLLAH